MTEAQAQLLTAKLAAAFPRDWSFAGKLTNAVYVERIQRIPSYEAAVDAVDVLIDTEARLPTIGQVRDEYQRHIARYRPKALEEPPLTPEARRENLSRIRKLAAMVSPKSVSPEEQD